MISRYDPGITDNIDRNCEFTIMVKGYVSKNETIPSYQRTVFRAQRTVYYF